MAIKREDIERAALESEGERSLLWVLGALKQIHDAGATTDPGPITPLGVTLWDQLHQSGFRPEDIKIAAALHIIYDGVMPQEGQGKIYAIVCLYKDHPEVFEKDDEKTEDTSR